MGAKECGEEIDDLLSDLEKDIKNGKDGETDYEPARDSLSSQGETATNDDNKIKNASRVPKKLSKREPSENSTRTLRGSSNRQEHAKLMLKTSSMSQKNSQMPVREPISIKTPTNKKENTIVSSITSSEVSEETEDKTIEKVKEIDVMDEAPVCNQSNGTDDETVEENAINDDKVNVYQKIEEMDSRIEKLEEELRELAALEMSFYSVCCTSAWKFST